MIIDGLGAFQIAAVEPLRMSQYLIALVNELRVLGVTTICTLESDVRGPSIQAPVGNLSVIAYNVILMRYIEVRSRLRRFVSVLKVRDGSLDPLVNDHSTSGADSW